MPSVLEQLIAFAFVSGAITVCLIRWEILDKPKKLLLSFIPLRFIRFERAMGTLIYCAQCMGFWVGFFSSFTLELPWMSTMPMVEQVIAGFVTSYTAMLLDTLVYGRKHGGEIAD